MEQFEQTEKYDVGSDMLPRVMLTRKQNRGLVTIVLLQFILNLGRHISLRELEAHLMKIGVLMLHNHFAEFRHLMLHNEFTGVEGNHHDISVLVSFSYLLETDYLWELFLHLLN